MPNCETQKLVCPHAQWADAEIDRLRAALTKICDVVGTSTEAHLIARSAIGDQQTMSEKSK